MPVNSVSTIVFSEREDSDDPKLLQIIQQAEAIFIAGSDQSNYVRFWQDSPVQDVSKLHPKSAAAKRQCNSASPFIARPPVHHSL
jgi:cyanophycinase-like exopeptidase